jgi:hypothetical protein
MTVRGSTSRQLKLFPPDLSSRREIRYDKPLSGRQEFLAAKQYGQAGPMLSAPVGLPRVDAKASRYEDERTARRSIHKRPCRLVLVGPEARFGFPISMSENGETLSRGAVKLEAWFSIKNLATERWPLATCGSTACFSSA